MKEFNNSISEKSAPSYSCEIPNDQWNSIAILKEEDAVPHKMLRQFGPPDQRYQQLANAQEIQVRALSSGSNTQYEFYTTIDGSERTVLQTDQQVEIAEKQLKQIQNDKVQEIEKAYGVDIGKDGEKTKSVDQSKDLPVTTPTIGESSAIEEALLHSVPDTTTTDGKPLRIVVGDKSWGSDFGAGGVKRDDEIVFAYSDSISYLKEVGVHELAHIGQAHREKDTGYDGYATELGWVNVKDDWLLRGKDESFWQNTGRDGLWIRTDADGNPADVNGKRVDNPFNPFDHGEDSNRVEKKNDAEVREIAVVKPYSTYFGNPHEMGAAMLTPFRDNRELRTKLYKVSADSYAVAKDLDQYQINAAFGTQPDGQPKFIRNPDGIVVENNDNNRRVVDEFEKKLRDTTAKAI